MLVRLRWFLLGVASTVGAGVYMAARLRRLRERLAPANLARASVRTVADSLDAAARWMDPAGRPGAPG